jgi:hypothetical protein
MSVLSSKVRHGLILLSVPGVLLAACSSASSDSQVPPPDDAGGSSGGSSSGAGSSNGASGSSGSSSGASSGASGGGSGSSSGSSSGPVGDGGCQTDLAETNGVHIKLSVTWAGTPTVLMASNGAQNVDIYLLSHTTNDGTGKLTGTARACGVTLPDVQLVLMGGASTPPKIHLAFPDIWDGSSMPKFNVTGTQNGRGPGGTIAFDKSVQLLGLKQTGSYSMASTMWPNPNGSGTQAGTFPQFQTSDMSDDDGDGKPGITLDSTLPDSTYQYVPTSIDFAHTGADNLYLVSRNEIALSGTIGSDCTTASGTATVSVFQNHVLGCHDSSSASIPNCSTTSGILDGPGFIDANRTVFVPGSATFTSKKMPDNATCADVRNALP